MTKELSTKTFEQTEKMIREFIFEANRLLEAPSSEEPDLRSTLAQAIGVLECCLTTMMICDEIEREKDSRIELLKTEICDVSKLMDQLKHTRGFF